MSNEIIDRFALFAGTDGGIESWLTPRTDPRIFERLKKIDSEPLSRSQLNQLLLLGHEAALSDGFFRYYWLHTPPPNSHPYRLDALEGFSPDYNDRNAIHSIEHLRWGLYRFYVDALLFFGNVRQAYRYLRGLSFETMAALYKAKCFDHDSKSGLLSRGPPLPLRQIPRDDRYLISEMACKSFDPISGDATSMLDALATSYKKLTKQNNRKSFTIKELIKGVVEQDRQYELEFVASEFADEKTHLLQI